MSGTSDTAGDNLESDNDTSDIQTVAKIQKQNSCAQCSAPCVVLTTADHHCLSMEDLSLWAMMIVCFSFMSNNNYNF
jgi:hypothetical protein